MYICIYIYVYIYIYMYIWKNYRTQVPILVIPYQPMTKVNILNRNLFFSINYCSIYLEQ